MLIDWFTIVAQALNFLVLVWLMKRFLYKPILHAIDEREKRIAAELASADKQKRDAQQERDEFRRKNQKFDQQRAALLATATDEAQAQRQQLLDEARKAAAALSSQRRETLRKEESNLHQAIIRRAQEEVFSISRKALADLAGTSLEERVVDVFVRRLRELDGEERVLLVSALKTSSSPVIVRTAFDLPADQCASTEEAIRETLGAETQIQFETAPDLLSGIELTTNGQKVAWSIVDYLASLEKGVHQLLEGQRESDAGPGPASEQLQPETGRQ